jgi:hypothetical protein
MSDKNTEPIVTKQDVTMHKAEDKYLPAAEKHGIFMALLGAWFWTIVFLIVMSICIKIIYI